MSNITPVPSYPSYPVSGIPEPGQDIMAESVSAIYQDIYNRIAFIKAVTENETAYIDNIATKTGLDVSNDELPIFASNFILSTEKNFHQAFEAIDSYLDTASARVDNIDRNVGGECSGDGTNTYDTPKFVVEGDSHHACIEKLDDQLYSTNQALNAIAPVVIDNQSKIVNVANKISTIATTPGIGLSYTSENFIANGDMIDSAISKLDKPIMTNRRINHFNYVQNLLNWRDVVFGESGGATPLAYHYDDLYNSSKINATYSTTNAYDNVNQSFSRSDSTWLYYSNIQAVPSGTNKVKIMYNGEGVVGAYATLSGNYTGTFTPLAIMDSWIDVPTGVQLIVKFYGNAGAKLYNYMILYKEE